MNAPALPAARPAGFGVLAFGLLLGLYFGVLTLVSGWRFTVAQFGEFWQYVVLLAAGFGLQVALYTRLRQVARRARESGAVMAASGTTSTAAMISCCAHYLANVAPVIGAAGVVTFATQYQVEFFWIGLAFNAAGIAFIGGRLWNATKEHARCAHT